MDIFNEFQLFPQQFFPSQSPQHNWLDINQYLQYQSTPNTGEPEVQNVESSFQPQRKLSDMFAAEPSFIPFEPFRKLSLVAEQAHQSEQLENQTTTKKQGKLAPSIVTKNVCYNICQKTIKLIQKGVYDQKLKTLCNQYEIEKEAFIKHLLQQKKNFTGPKALQLYIEQQTAYSQTFRKFMKWFLIEKYLRHCLTGDMDNKEAYIKYKNEVILVILG